MTSESRSQESGVGNRVLSLVGFFAGLAGCVLVVALFPGCGKPPRSITDNKEAATAKGDPWEAARKRLRKDSDLAACKAALSGLNSDLPADPKAPKPTGLSKEAEAALAALVPLNPDDLNEVRPSAFTSHDPVYLAECLYLRDAARSLDVPPRPGQSADQIAADRADLAFAWVCRQVYLSPWNVPTPNGLLTVALPPTYVLRRGYGSGLERMYVFLALLQQMNLDGCLVGPPDAKDEPSWRAVFGPDKKTLLTGGGRGPFWAAGMRVGNDVRLYDPWRGQPFPAPLSALRANPEAHKAWFEDKLNASGSTAEDAKQATVYLAVPVNSLAPRMVTLEQQLRSEGGAKLAVGAAALRNAFPDPKPAFWNPPSDLFAYGRTARTFLPAELGGADRTPQGGDRLYESYLREQLPQAAFVTPPELRDNPEAAERIRGAMLSIYGLAFLGFRADQPGLGPNARERLQRGQFQDAARELVSRQDQFAQGLERLRNRADAEAEIRKWAAEARRLYDELGLARSRRDAAAEQAALAAVESHWKPGGAAEVIIDRVSAEVGRAEATFLLALCKHEQAERVQARLERASGPEAEALTAEAKAAWEAADGEWQTYTGRAAAQAGFPGRAAHAQSLAARAAAFAQKK